jgi:hypothetical protein
MGTDFGKIDGLVKLQEEYSETGEYNQNKDLF